MTLWIGICKFFELMDIGIGNGEFNLSMVYAYFEIGRIIVEEEQNGKNRAAYGKQILQELSDYLTVQFGKGFSVDNLKLMCKDKNNAVVEITLPEDNNQIFASKYETVLPSKEELKKLLTEHLDDEDEGEGS